MVSLRYTHANQLHFLTEKTNEQIAGEYPEVIKQIGRWKDMPNGNGGVSHALIHECF